MQAVVTTTYSEPEFDAKIFDAVNKALQLNGFAIKAQERKPNKIPIDIKEACRITGLAKPTIYALAPKGAIPSYRKGKRLYFFEDELLAWIKSGKRMTAAEIDAAADHALKTA